MTRLEEPRGKTNDSSSTTSPRCHHTELSYVPRFGISPSLEVRFTNNLIRARRLSQPITELHIESYPRSTCQPHHTSHNLHLTTTHQNVRTYPRIDPHFRRPALQTPYQETRSLPQIPNRRATRRPIRQARPRNPHPVHQHLSYTRAWQCTPRNSAECTRLKRWCGFGGVSCVQGE